MLDTITAPRDEDDFKDAGPIPASSCRKPGPAHAKPQLT